MTTMPTIPTIPVTTLSSSMPDCPTPVTKNRDKPDGFPDRSPETLQAETKISYLCNQGAAILSFVLSRQLSEEFNFSRCSQDPSVKYNCIGQCDVCNIIEQCTSGRPPKFLEDQASKFEVSRVKGGITNLMLFLKHPDLPNQALRIFGLGSEHIIDRPREQVIVEYLAQRGIGKSVTSRFVSADRSTEGQLEEWIEGETLTPEQMRSQEISFGIAKRIALLHTIPVPDNLLKETTTTNGKRVTRISLPHVQKAYEWLKSADTVIQNDHRFGDLKLFDLNMVMSYLDKIMKLENSLQTHPDRLFHDEQKFVHGDLLSGNIVLQSDSNVRFIDFEYTDVGGPLYDLANHFNECTGFECSEADYDKYYPDEATQRAFISVYVREVVRLKELKLTEQEIKEEEHRIYAEVQVNVLVSHFYWGAWAINKALWQSTEKQIEFEFRTYAFQRMAAGLSWAFGSRLESCL